jgi:hypothetical protein
VIKPVDHTPIKLMHGFAGNVKKLSSSVALKNLKSHNI